MWRGTHYNWGITRHARYSLLSPAFIVTSINFSSFVGHVFLERSLFSEYSFSLPGRNPLSNTVDYNDDGGEPDSAKYAEDSDSAVSFGISLSALLECLQIFGADSFSRERWGRGGFASTMGPSGISENQPTKPTGTCDFIYQGEGHTLNLMWVNTLFKEYLTLFIVFSGRGFF